MSTHRAKTFICVNASNPSNSAGKAGPLSSSWVPGCGNQVTKRLHSWLKVPQIVTGRGRMPSLASGPEVQDLSHVSCGGASELDPLSAWPDSSVGMVC